MNLQKLLTRKFVPLVNDIIFSAQNNEKFFHDMTGFPNYVKNMEVLDDVFYFDVDWMEEIQKNYSSEPPQRFISYIETAYKHAEELVSFARNLASNKTSLQEQCHTSIRLLRNLLAFLPVTHPLAKTIEERVGQLLKQKGVSDENMQTVLLDITTPEKINAPLAEQFALYDIATKMTDQQSFDLEAALDQHINQFAFLGYREPFALGYTKEFFRSHLTDILANPPVHPAGTYQFSFSEEEQKIIDLMKEFVYFRNYRTEKLYEALYYIEPLWMKVAEQYGLSHPQDFSYYLIEEVNSLLAENKKVDEAIITERKKHFAILLHNNEWNILAGDAVMTLQQKNTPTEKMKELKGVPACKGIIRGTARIVLSAKEQDKIQTGDILITNMTTPDFLPSMKRALGFVTDEGGITCHAAIVAREMGKPCIIGTKIATQVFHDGDMIEVNAMSGTVRLI